MGRQHRKLHTAKYRCNDKGNDDNNDNDDNGNDNNNGIDNDNNTNGICNVKICFNASRQKYIELHV